MLSKIWEGMLDNEYIFLAMACCAVVIIPILACYAISFTKTILAAAN